ncbi:MAG: hypothetical protein V4563_14535 [Pseudomonadota bacterium]
MKRFIAPPLLILVFALAAFPVVFSGPGCTTSQQAVAYKTLNITATSVDAGMKAFADAVVAGKVTAPTQAKVRDLHGRYALAMQAAILTAHFDTSAPAPDKLKALASELLTLISEALK